MFVMTARVNKTAIFLGLGVVAVTIGLLIALFSGGSSAEPTAATTPAVDTNDARVKFLADLGWEVTASPTESMQVRIPKESTEVFDRYNNLQKSQGYDLSSYAGKNVMRYVYEVRNFSGATQPVYATLLVYKDQIIGGDVTDTSAKGQIRGFKKPEDATASTTAPAETTAPETTGETKR